MTRIVVVVEYVTVYIILLVIYFEKQWSFEMFFEKLFI